MRRPLPTLPRPSVTPRSPGWSAACSSVPITGRRRSTTRSRRWCSTATSNRSTAAAATSWRATSRNSRSTATNSTTRSPPASSSPPSPSSTGSSNATASAWRYALKLLDTEPDFTLDETFEFDREHAPWADLAGRTRRALAQARQERRPVADAHGQDLGRNARRPARSATSASPSAPSRSPPTTCSRTS